MGRAKAATKRATKARKTSKAGVKKARGTAKAKRTAKARTKVPRAAKSIAGRRKNGRTARIAAQPGA